MRATLLFLVFSAVVASGCGGENDDPAGAAALFAAINANGGYHGAQWQRAPDYPVRRPSFTKHGRAVEIFINAPMVTSLTGATALTAWPDGSIVVKESYSGNSLSELAVMQKRGSEWFWAEYDTDGTAKYSGKPGECIDCHQKRAGYSDWVYALEFPH